MPKLDYDESSRVIFTKEMKKDYTILLPMMAPIHFNILKNVLVYYGYKAVLLKTECPEISEIGLKYVHNDTCYPAILVIGQFIHALQSGKYDVNKTALMITQTGGGCRASNYIYLLRKALKKAGFPQVPVISLNLSGLEKNSGFKLTIPMVRRMLISLVYGDLLMILSNQVRPYEIYKGDTDMCIFDWVERINKYFSNNHCCSFKNIKRVLKDIVKSFNEIPTNHIPKVKVGVVGEIYVKYSSLGNNGLEKFLEKENCEVFVPGILSFMLFKIDNRLEDIKLYGGSSVKYKFINILMSYIVKLESMLVNEIKENSKFVAPSLYYHVKSLANGVIGYGNKMGEGWLLTAEMIELVDLGYKNIVCTQPFGCLPNHICGKGMIRQIRSIRRESNIVAIDYDPGAAKVNQENRIKLMLSIARENLECNIDKSSTIVFNNNAKVKEPVNAV